MRLSLKLRCCSSNVFHEQQLENYDILLTSTFCALQNACLGLTLSSRLIANEGS